MAGYDKCGKCGELFHDDDIWTLQFLGYFCIDCALFVLAYWKINLDEAFEKIEKAKAESKKLVRVYEGEDTG